MIILKENYERFFGSLKEKKLNVSSISDDSKTFIKDMLDNPDEVYNKREVDSIINSLSDDGVSKSTMKSLYKKSKWQFLDAIEDLLNY